jgi:hypothetical protein
MAGSPRKTARRKPPDLRTGQERGKMVIQSAHTRPMLRQLVDELGRLL